MVVTPMVLDYVTARLERAGVCHEFACALRVMSAQDLGDGGRTAPQQTVIPTLYELLAEEPGLAIQPFAVAWSLLFAAAKRLDHLEDGDAPAHALPTTASLGAQYNLVFGYYVLAQALLDDLRDNSFLPELVLQLHQLWSDCVLRVAGGQQGDLEWTANQSVPGLPALDHYQRIAHAKAGALFALAFGGAALLARCSTETVARLTFIGELFGTLLQYSDDLLDSVSQPITAPALPQAYHAAVSAQPTPLTADMLTPFWQQVYRTYLHQVDEALGLLPPAVQQGIKQLFATTFRTDDGLTTS